MKKTTLFVYGSLMRGYCNHGGLAGQQFLRVAETKPRYVMVDYGGFPALVQVDSAGVAVQGELWEIDARCHAELDVLEGVKEGLYRRGQVELDEGAVAESYFYDRAWEHLPLVGVRWERVE